MASHLSSLAFLSKTHRPLKHPRVLLKIQHFFPIFVVSDPERLGDLEDLQELVHGRHSQLQRKLFLFLHDQITT